MAFESAIVAIGTGDTDIYEMPALNDGAVVLSIGNATGGAVSYSFKFYKQATAVTTQLATGVSVAANKIEPFPKPIAMQAGDKIIMSASAGSSLTAQCTVTRGGAATIVNTINPKGAWDSGANYVKADAVSHDGTSYLATAANTNSEPEPDGSNTDWMILVEASVGGDFIGPAGSTSGNIVTFGDATGKLGADGGASLSDLLAKVGGTLAGALNWSIAATVASATTADIGAAASNVVEITGTTTITGLGTIAAGAMRWVKFSGALTLTHNGTSLILPGGANITTAAGDTAAFVSEGSGNWRCLGYQRANGGIIAQAAASDFWAGTSVSKPTTPKTIADAGAWVSISSASTINTDGAVGQNFVVAPLDHNATVAAPTNLIDGKTYTWLFKQGSTGGTLAFNSIFVFPSAPTASVGAGKYDICAATYYAADSKLIARFSKGS